MSERGVETTNMSLEQSVGPVVASGRAGDASPRRQGRFLIIEPPREEEEEELSSSSSSSPAPLAVGGGVDMQLRFARAMNSESVLPAKKSEASVGSAEKDFSNSGSKTSKLNSADSAPSGASTERVQVASAASGTPQAFTVKNTVGPLFDPAMAAAFGWNDEDSISETSSESLSVSASISLSSNLLPPMSALGSGQLTQKEREKVRKDWLQNIVLHKQEQDRIQAEQQRVLAQKMQVLQSLRNAAASTSQSQNSTALVSPRSMSDPPPLIAHTTPTDTHSPASLGHPPHSHAATGTSTSSPPLNLLHAPSSPSILASLQTPPVLSNSTPATGATSASDSPEGARKSSASSSASAHHTASTTTVATAPTSSQLPVLDLATYQASKSRLSEEPPNSGSVPSPVHTTKEAERRGVHRRSASDISIEAKMQARRESGPPPPRPVEDPGTSKSATNSAREKKSGKSPELPKSKASKKGLDVTVTQRDRSTTESVISTSRSDTNLSASASSVSSDKSVSSTTSPMLGKRVKIQDEPAKESRGRSASVSKKIGGFIGRIFESKPKDRHASDRPPKKHSKSSISSNASSIGLAKSETSLPSAPLGEDSVDSSPNTPRVLAHSAATTGEAVVSSASSESIGVTPSTSPHNISPSPQHAASASAPHLIVTPSSPAPLASSSPNLTSSSVPTLTSTNSVSERHDDDTTGSASEKIQSSTIPAGSDTRADSNASSTTNNTNTSDTTSQTSASSTNKANRPRPPIPPKPAILRHAKTMRPSTNTKQEFGLDDR